MISAKTFAAQSGLWHRVTPALEHFTRWVNSNSGSVGARVGRYGPRERAAFIAETAFSALASGTGPTTSLQAAAFDMLERLPRGAGQSRELTASEEREVFEIMANVHRFLERVPGRQMRFRPILPGCGIVETAEADIITDSELIEVKAVQRPFRGSDFRQVLTYAALGYASGIDLQVITLLNPRLGAYFTSPVQPLALDMGSGSWVDLMQELVELMTVYEVSD